MRSPRASTSRGVGKADIASLVRRFARERKARNQQNALKTHLSHALALRSYCLRKGAIYTDFSPPGRKDLL
jgi:hypothetical protein